MHGISLIIPVKNEQKSLSILHKEIQHVFKKIRKPYELIFINDGSTDSSLQVLESLKKKDRAIRIISFTRNQGKSAALSAGFEKSTGDTVITLDADLQDDPREIPKLLKKAEEGYDLVTGMREKRNDSYVKKLSSFLFNRGTSFISGVSLNDLNSGLKLLRREVVQDIFLYGELHRFIPVLAYKKQFRVTEVAVNHRARKFGASHYGFERGIHAIIDLVTSLFLTDYSTKPAHFFGMFGIVFFTIGFILDAYVTIIKIVTGTTQGRIPLFLGGILGMVIGLQLISTGLIGEMMNYYYHRLSRQMKK